MPTAADKIAAQPLYDLPPFEDDGDAASSQWKNSTDSGIRSADSLGCVKFRTNSASSDPRYPVPKQRMSNNEQVAFVVPADSESEYPLRATNHDGGSRTASLNDTSDATVSRRSSVAYPQKNNPFASASSNPFDSDDGEWSVEMASAPPAIATPTPSSLPDSAISSSGEASDAPSATLKMLQQLRVRQPFPAQGIQHPHDSRHTAATARAGIAASASSVASLDGDPLDGLRDKWTALRGALNQRQRPTAPQGDTSSTADTSIARDCSAFHDSLMRHATQGSARSLHHVAKTLKALTLDAGATDHTQFRDTLRYTTLQPHLGSARIEHLFRLARLRDPQDRSRAEIISTATKLLTGALAKNKAAAKAAVPLADALLDAIGTECHRTIRQRWINNVELAIAANKALKAAPQANRERETARLVEALRELSIISQQVDFDKSPRQRLMDLHTGLSKIQARELDNMLGLGDLKSEHTNARHFGQFLNAVLPSYETDAGMQARMVAFIEQWRNARQENPAPIRRVPDFSTMRESAYHRSWAPVRFFSRLRQLLTGKNKQEPTKTRNEIKDLVAALATGKPLRRELKGIDRLDRIFQPTPLDAQPEPTAKRAEFKEYLQHTLRKLAPQEARALHESLVKAGRDLQTTQASELRALGWAEALHSELERALEREFHVRELLQCVRDTDSALKMSRRTEARQHTRGEALIAAADKLARTMAAATEIAPKTEQQVEQAGGPPENAFDLLTEAVARNVDFDGVRTNDRRIIEEAVADMNAVLGYKCPQWGQARNGTLYTLAHAGYLATR